MNERIRELARDAGFFPELNWDHTGWHAAGHNDTFEKFAELIVRECARVASDYDGAHYVGTAIERHFGVE